MGFRKSGAAELSNQVTAQSAVKRSAEGMSTQTCATQVARHVRSLTVGLLSSVSEALGSCPVCPACIPVCRVAHQGLKFSSRQNLNFVAGRRPFSFCPN